MFGLDWLTPEMLAAAGLTAATAGAAAPALAAAAPAAAGTGALGAAGTGLTLGGVSAAAPFAGAATAAPAAATGGLLGSAAELGTQAMGYIKPIGQAASAAGAVQGLIPQSQPVTTPPPQFGGAGSQAFTGLLQDSMNTEQMRAQEEMRRREAQQKLIGLIGGM